MKTVYQFLIVLEDKAGVSGWAACCGWAPQQEKALESLCAHALLIPGLTSARGDRGKGHALYTVFTGCGSRVTGQGRGLLPWVWSAELSLIR